MIELAPEGAPGLYRQGVAGDTFNTATYLARAGLDTHMLTRLGDDEYSQIILDRIRQEGIGKGSSSELITRCKNRRPGLYMISTDTEGERRFSYWREQSPARELFDQTLALPDFDVFYFSGITLATTRSGIFNLKSLLQELRQRQCTIVFDPNYRPALWDDREQARRFYGEVLPKCDIALPSIEDEKALWDIETEEDCLALYSEFNLRELVIKGHDLTTHVHCGQQQVIRKATPVEAVDTTGAGDAFNAGYLAARFTGRSIDDAITSAQNLSAKVIQHPGAILPTNYPQENKGD